MRTVLGAQKSAQVAEVLDAQAGHPVGAAGPRRTAIRSPYADQHVRRAIELPIGVLEASVFRGVGWAEARVVGEQGRADLPLQQIYAGAEHEVVARTDRPERNRL